MARGMNPTVRSNRKENVPRRPVVTMEIDVRMENHPLCQRRRDPRFEIQGMIPNMSSEDLIIGGNDIVKGGFISLQSNTLRLISGD